MPEDKRSKTFDTIAHLQGIDVKSMNRIFIGLVKCGAWGCFDEFNRLEEGVLSALSVNIQAIQNALKDKKKIVHLSNQQVCRYKLEASQCKIITIYALRRSQTPHPIHIPANHLIPVSQ